MEFCSRVRQWYKDITLCKSHKVYNERHDKMAFSEIISSDSQPYLFSGNLNPLFKRNETKPFLHILRGKILQDFCVFWPPCPGVISPATLNAEVLGTRLWRCHSGVWQRAVKVLGTRLWHCHSDMWQRAVKALGTRLWRCHSDMCDSAQ